MPKITHISKKLWQQHKSRDENNLKTPFRDFNSLALGNLCDILGTWYFQIISVIDGWCISFEISLRWMSLDLTDDKSTLVQVMAWCHQATSHYLSQCWPRYLSPYGITGPQWVNSSPPSAAHTSQWIRSALFQIMACHLLGAKPLTQPMVDYCWLDPYEQTSVKF